MWFSIESLVSQLNPRNRVPESNRCIPLLHHPQHPQRAFDQNRLPISGSREETKFNRVKLGYFPRKQVTSFQSSNINTNNDSCESSKSIHIFISSERRLRCSQDVPRTFGSYESDKSNYCICLMLPSLAKSYIFSKMPPPEACWADISRLPQPIVLLFF